MRKFAIIVGVLCWLAMLGVFPNDSQFESKEDSLKYEEKKDAEVSEFLSVPKWIFVSDTVHFYKHFIVVEGHWYISLGDPDNITMEYKQYVIDISGMLNEESEDKREDTQGLPVPKRI